jgi:hypothetical protein
MCSFLVGILCVCVSQYQEVVLADHHQTDLGYMVVGDTRFLKARIKKSRSPHMRNSPEEGE